MNADRCRRNTFGLELSIRLVVLVESKCVASLSFWLFATVSLTRFLSSNRKQKFVPLRFRFPLTRALTDPMCVLLFSVIEERSVDPVDFLDVIAIGKEEPLPGEFDI